MSVHALLQLAIAQAAMIRRDVGLWLINIFIAVLSMAVFGWLFTPGPQPFDLAVVDEDGTEASRTLVRAFDGVENAKLRQGWREKELSALENGDRGAVVVIPQGFADMLGKGGASLLVYYDSSDPIRIGTVTATVEAVVDNYNAKLVGHSSAVTVEKQAVSTRNVRFIDFLTPGMVGMTLMWTNLAVGYLLVGWREQGILRRLGVTPLRPGTLIASQALSFAFISLVQVFIILAMGRFVFDVHIQGSYLWLAVTVVLGVLSMLSVGYVIASFVKTVTSANAFRELVAFPMLFLGKSYFPLDPPAALAPVVNALPLTYLNDALRELVNHGGDLGDLWLDWAVLAAWVISGFFLSMRLFRWQ
jgi:ABC-2 type transport system permease protein